jgi:hypothetical protein
VDETVVFRKSTTKIGWILAACIGFVLIGALFIAFPGQFDRSGRYPEFLVVVFGLASGGYFGWLGWQRSQELLKVPTLEVSRIGFTLSLADRVIAVPWEAIESIEVWRTGLWHSVAWKLTASQTGQSELRLGPAPSGFDGSIGNGWSDSPEKIVSLMTEQRRRHQSA